MKKVVFFIFLSTLLAVFALIFLVVKERYGLFPDTAKKNFEFLSDAKSDSDPSSPDPENSEVPQNPGDTPLLPGQTFPPEPETNEQGFLDSPIGGKTGSSYREITPNICSGSCKKFEKDEKEKKYCREVCGLEPLRKETEEGCLALAGLERDYCWKHLAVSRGDHEICEKISDANLKKSCQSRVTEDWLEKQRT